MKTKITKILVASSLLIGLMGCEIATPVVPGGSYEGLTSTDPNKARIFIYRDKAFAGSANQYDVMLNGTLVGSLPNGSFFSIDTDPGEKKIEPRTLTSFGFGKGSTINVEQSQSYCLKLTLNFCVQCKSADINPVDNKQCADEMKSLKKVRLKKR